MKNKRNSSLRMNLHYCGVDVDCDIENNCQESGCDEEGMCRCGIIADARVVRVNAEEIVRCVWNKENCFTKYCIARVLTSHKIYENNKWCIGIEGGYYGEEIADVKLERSFADEVEPIIHQILGAKTNKEKLFVSLIDEYGSILPELESRKDFEIIKVSIKDMFIGNNNWGKKVEHSYNPYNKDYDGIVGLCLNASNAVAYRYRIIDGYHRYFALKDHQKEVKIILDVS